MRVAIVGNSTDDGAQVGVRCGLAADQEPLLPRILKTDRIGDQGFDLGDGDVLLRPAGSDATHRVDRFNASPTF